MGKKVYISGAIAHHDLNERRATFGAAAAFLREGGLEPVNPFDNGLPQPGDWRELTRNELDTLMRTLEEKERNAAQAVFEDE